VLKKFARCTCLKSTTKAGRIGELYRWRAAIHADPELGGISTIRDICDREGLIGLIFKEIFQ